MIRTMIFIMCTGWLQPVWAGINPLQFRHITPKNGLAHNFVLDIMQDRDGFIWLATAAGLSRYDGINFRTYTARRDKTGIQGNYIVALLQDKRGRIWAGTKSSGLSRLDTATQSFTNFTHNPTDPTGLSSNNIANRALYEDVLGTIWVGTENSGLNSINPETGNITHYAADPVGPYNLGSNIVHAITGQPGDNTGRFLWVGTEKGLVQLDLEQKKVRHISLQPKGTEVAELPVHALYVESEQTVWVGTLQGLIALDTITGNQFVFRHDPNDPTTLSHNAITDIQSGSEDTLWIATQGGGLNHLDPATGTVIRYTSDGTNDLSLASDQLSCIFMDKTGAMWIGTHGFGLDYLDPLLQKFTVYRPSAHSANALSNGLVLDIFLENENRVWLGTGGGLNKFDPQTQTFTTYTLPASTFVHNVFVDSQGIHWVGTWGAGIYQFDPTTGVFTSFRLEGMDINSCFIFFEDNMGQLWIGTELHGLYVVSPDRRSFQQLANTQDSRSLSNNLVHRVMQDSRGTIWVATLNGLNRYRPKSNDFVRYQHDPKDQNSLSDNSVKNILEDKDGLLWLTTDFGLNKFDPSTGSFAAYFMEDGLPHNRVDSIVQDDAGLFWIGTPKGMCRFDPETETSVNFDYLDGLQGNTFTLVAKKDHAGHLYFSGTTGLQVFDPAAITPNPHKPPLTFLSYMVSNQVIDRAPGNELVLGPEDNTFGFEFAALNYTQPKKNSYSYKLEGFDKTWRATKERRIRYTNLNPGNYLFRIKGSNNDGIWNEEGIAIPVRILPAWWEANWFRGLAVCLSILTLLLLERWRIRIVKARNTQLESLVAVRTVELEQMNGKLRDLAQTDPLTQLYNRLKTDRVLEQEADRFLRYGNIFSVILFDLDHFKQVNDMYGHRVGDEILKAVAHLLQKNTRTTDTVGRWGGEEFIVICPETTLDKARQKAQKLCQLLAAHDFIIVGHMTASFGVSNFGKEGDTLTKLFSRTDEALYAAKEGGRNRVEAR